MDYKVDQETKDISVWAEEKALAWTEELAKRGWRVEFVHGSVSKVPSDAPVENAGELLRGVDIHLSRIPLSEAVPMRVVPEEVVTDPKRLATKGS